MLWRCEGGHAEGRQGFGREDLQPGKGGNVVARGRFGEDLSAGEIGLSSSESGTRWRCACGDWV